MCCRPRKSFFHCSWSYALVTVVVFLWSLADAKAQFPLVATTPSTCGLNNGTATVTAFGGAPYSFQLDMGAVVNPGVNTYTFTGLGPGNHSITVVDAANPGGIQPNFTIAGPPAPQAFILVTNATCTTPGEAVLSALGGTAPFTYSIDGLNYFPSSKFTGLAGGSTITPIVQDFYGCLASAPATTIPLTNDFVQTVGTQPSQICAGGSLSLPVTSNGTQFTWTPATGLSDPTVVSPVATPTVSTTYVLTAMRGTCGPLQSTVQVNVDPVPVPDAGPDAITCVGKAVTLQGGGGPPGSTYSWSPSTYLSSTNVPFPVVTNPQSTITYTLSIKGANGCSSLTTDDVTITVTPSIVVTAIPSDTLVSVGQPIQLLATSPVDATGPSYQWTPAINLNNPFIANPVAVFNAPGQATYVVLLTNANGCTGTDTVRITALAVSDIIVPNAFSPNGDGHNDVLRPRLPGIKELKYFSVFGRFGQQVFMTNNPSLGWDGAVNGRIVEAGVYVWMAMGVDVNGRVVERKGTVMLVR